MKRFCDFLCSHLNFSIPNVTWIAIISAMAIMPSIMFLPREYGFENGLLENIQMFVLFCGFWFSLKPKTDKKFFYFIALVLSILVLREINCGRTIFFPVPGIENAFYSWKEIKYGWLVHPLYGLYIVGVGIYFLKNKLFINLWEKFSKTKLPFWNIALMLLGMGLGIYAEECCHNFVFEEITELLFYVALVGIIYLYSQDKRYIQ